MKADAEFETKKAAMSEFRHAEDRLIALAPKLEDWLAPEQIGIVAYLRAKRVVNEALLKNL